MFVSLIVKETSDAWGSRFARYDQTWHDAGDVVNGTWLTKMEDSPEPLLVAANILNWFEYLIFFFLISLHRICKVCFVSFYNRNLITKYKFKPYFPLKNKPSVKCNDTILNDCYYWNTLIMCSLFCKYC